MSLKKVCTPPIFYWPSWILNRLDCKKNAFSASNWYEDCWSKSRYKTGVINDPYGLPPVPAGNNFRSILKFWDGRTDGRTTCVKIVITTGRDCGLASWINRRKITLMFLAPYPNKIKNQNFFLFCNAIVSIHHVPISLIFLFSSWASSLYAVTQRRVLGVFKATEMLLHFSCMYENDLFKLFSSPLTLCILRRLILNVIHFRSFNYPCNSL